MAISLPTKNMGHPLFDVAGTVKRSREDELGELRGDRDPVSIYIAFFALCSFAALSSVVGDLSWVFAASSAAASSCRAMTGEASTGDQWASGRAPAPVVHCALEQPVVLIPHRVLAYEASAFALVEGSCD